MKNVRASTSEIIRIPLRFIPLLVALLPFLCIHLCYIVSAAFEHVAWCVPYWDSCTSISRLGRQLPEKLIFKALMIPTAVLSCAFWLILGKWLRWQYQVGKPLMVLGVLANIFVVIYVVALGEVGDAYYLMRRVGVILFFSLTMFSQLMFVHYMQRHIVTNSCHASVRHIYQIQYGLALVVFIVGIGSVLLDVFYEHYDNIEDAIEWILALLINAHFLTHYWLWKYLDINIRFDDSKT